MVSRLADLEGGMIPLTRRLLQAGEKGFWPGRLRAIAQGKEIPPWPLLERIGRACGVPDLSLVQQDWREQYRDRLRQSGCSELGTEVRLLIAEMSATVREFSTRLGVHRSGLTRDLQRLDRGRPVNWPQIERILCAAGLGANDRRWKQIHAWWYATRIEG